MDNTDCRNLCEVLCLGAASRQRLERTVYRVRSLGQQLSVRLDFTRITFEQLLPNLKKGTAYFLDVLQSLLVPSPFTEGFLIICLSDYLLLIFEIMKTDLLRE